MDDSYLQFVVSLLDDDVVGDITDRYESSDPDDCKLFIQLINILIKNSNVNSCQFYHCKKNLC